MGVFFFSSHVPFSAFLGVGRIGGVFPIVIRTPLGCHPFHIHIASSSFSSSTVSIVELLPFQPTRVSGLLEKMSTGHGIHKEVAVFHEAGTTPAAACWKKRAAEILSRSSLQTEGHDWGSWHCDAKIACCASVAEPVQRRVTRRFATKWLGLFSSQHY